MTEQNLLGISSFSKKRKKVKHVRFLIRRLPCVAAGGHFSCAADAICANWLPLPQRPRATSFHQIDLSFNGISRFSPIGNQQAGDLLLIHVISNLPIYNQGRSVRQTLFLTSHLPVCLSSSSYAVWLFLARVYLATLNVDLCSANLCLLLHICVTSRCVILSTEGWEVAGEIRNALAGTRLARWPNLPLLFW